jgi:hypothetical protein
MQSNGYREQTFGMLYPDRVDMTGKSMLKSLVAEQMLVTVATDAVTRFRSRCSKLCITKGAKDK